MKILRTLGSVDEKVEEQTSDMNSNDEGSGEFCVVHSDSLPALEDTEDIFNDMPDTVHDCTLIALFGF